MAKIIIEHFSTFSGLKNSSNSTPLHEATNSGNQNIVKLLLEKYEQPELLCVLSEEEGQNKEGLTPFHIACLEKHYEIVNMFFQSVPEESKVKLANALGDKKKTPLHFACRGGDSQIVQLLCDNGAKSLPNENDTYPIHVAAHFGHETLVNHFVEEYKDIEDKYHNTPLNIATRYNQVKVIGFLRNR